MKKALIIVVILALAGAGYFLLKPKPQPTVPRNPGRVVNEEITSENYKDYSREEYEKAVAEKKTIVLYFTANWCPICREQEPINMETFDEINDKDVIALRVHILDSQETEETKALAEKYEVTYQHTYVILKPGGEVSSKYTGPLSKEEIKARIIAAKEG